MKLNYFVIKYRNPNYDTVYCINGGKDKESIVNYWKQYESPKKYELLDIIEVSEEKTRGVIDWLANRKMLNVRKTEKNIKFLNDITNNRFNEIYNK